MAENEFDLAKKAGRPAFRENRISAGARGCKGHLATTGEGGTRKPASDVPARRPSTPEKKPGTAPLAPSQQGKRKWDQSWTSGHGAQSSKWPKSRS